MPQIYDMGPTALLPLQRKACWGFFHPKNSMALAGFEPANLGIKGQHATARPPKPYIWLHKFQNLTFMNRTLGFAQKYEGESKVKAKYI